MFLFPCLCNLQAATKILARQLVRLRQQIANLQGSRAQMRGIATHTQVHSIFSLPLSYFLYWFISVLLSPVHVCIVFLSTVLSHLQAMHANTSVAVGMKGATKAMAAMNKVGILHFGKFIICLSHPKCKLNSPTS